MIRALNDLISRQALIVLRSHGTPGGEVNLDLDSEQRTYNTADVIYAAVALLNCLLHELQHPGHIRPAQLM